MFLHLDQALAADRSAEVTQEDEDEWRLEPKVGQADFAIRFAEEDAVRCPLAQGQIHGGGH
ncbi:MAG: hypothetical protein GY772_11100 [bacterium]|jgi:hypothetical protein|nr:hypothetical protein [Deltaproteobacteria bacterium]MCP4241097.1 hypothetical protein [bacterium]